MTFYDTLQTAITSKDIDIINSIYLETDSNPDKHEFVMQVLSARLNEMITQDIRILSSLATYFVDQNNYIKEYDEICRQIRLRMSQRT